MKFRVEISPSAVRDAFAAFDYIAIDSQERAARWYEGLIKAIEKLDTHLRRYRRAVECDEFDIELRQLLYRSYRVLFTMKVAKFTSTRSATQLVVGSKSDRLGEIGGAMKLGR